MKKITKEYEVFTVNELSETAKERARENYNEYQDFPFMTEAMTEQLKDLLAEKSISYEIEPKVLYSLSNCQGDGVCFTGTFSFENKYTIIVDHRSRYYHEKSVDYDTEETETGEYTTKSEEAETRFKEIFETICRTLEKWGYDYIDQENSMETFIEACEANDYTFLSTGEMFSI